VVGVVAVVVVVACSGVLMSGWWSSVPVNYVVVEGCGCGCGWWSCVVIGVNCIVDGGVVGGFEVDMDDGNVVECGTVLVGVHWGGGGVVHRFVDVGSDGGLVCGVGGGVVVGISAVLRGFLLP
jgi:hypothetical protein